MRPDYHLPPKPINNPDHISILLPTYGRPEKLTNVFENFQKMTEHKPLVDIWLYVDDDDEITHRYIESNQWKQYGIDIHWLIEKPTKSMGDMFNQLWQQCTTNPGIYFPFCDDYVITTPKWDTILRDYTSRYKDGIMLGYPTDDHHATYQITIPIPSAQWLNTLGYFFTNRFYFWYDDMWLDRIANLAQRKVLIPIRIITQGGKGTTPRMKNLPFWNRYFTCTLDDRFADAVKLLEVIHNDDAVALEKALQNARESAAIQIHKSSQGELDSERAAELALSDPDYAPSASKLIRYFEAELYAVEDLLFKVAKAIERSELSDAMILLNALELASFNIPDINYIRATLCKDSGYFTSAAQYLLEHVKQYPDDIKSTPLYDEFNNKLDTPSNFNATSSYLSNWLGITDNYSIFFPSKIDEELYFIIQGFIYDVLNHGGQIDSILVVGAGSGEGIVQAIVSAYPNSDARMLFCIEPKENEFHELAATYSNVATLCNCSSVSTENYISADELAAFYKYIPSIMNNFPLELFTEMLNSEKQYLDTSHRSLDCINDIKRLYNRDRFYFVVLNGSQFSGKADLDAIYGADFILLTSINSVKDYANHRRLCEDDNYSLILTNASARAGYSMFYRVN